MSVSESDPQGMKYKHNLSPLDRNKYNHSPFVLHLFLSNPEAKNAVYLTYDMYKYVYITQVQEQKLVYEPK